MFLKLARSEHAKSLKEYIVRVIQHVTDVDNLTSDIVQNVQNTKAILQADLLSHLTEAKIEEQDEDSYE